jgi:hypothetical protein
MFLSIFGLFSDLHAQFPTQRYSHHNQDRAALLNIGLGFAERAGMNRADKKTRASARVFQPDGLSLITI